MSYFASLAISAGGEGGRGEEGERERKRKGTERYVGGKEIK